ncbi:uncharacterized protein LOC144819833 [Lissotriton helveticus]
MAPKNAASGTAASKARAAKQAVREQKLAARRACGSVSEEGACPDQQPHKRERGQSKLAKTPVTPGPGPGPSVVDLLRKLPAGAAVSSSPVHHATSGTVIAAAPAVPAVPAGPDSLLSPQAVFALEPGTVVPIEVPEASQRSKPTEAAEARKSADPTSTEATEAEEAADTTAQQQSDTQAQMDGGPPGTEAIPPIPSKSTMQIAPTSAGLVSSQQGSAPIHKEVRPASTPVPQPTQATHTLHSDVSSVSSVEPNSLESAPVHPQAYTTPLETVTSSLGKEITIARQHLNDGQCATDFKLGSGLASDTDKEPSEFFTISEGAEESILLQDQDIDSDSYSLSDPQSDSEICTNTDASSQDSDPDVVMGRHRRHTVLKKKKGHPGSSGRPRAQSPHTSMQDPPSRPHSDSSPFFDQQNATLTSVMDTVLQAIASHREQTSKDGRRAQQALHKVQGVVRKLSKSVAASNARMTDMEDRIVVNEAEATAVKEQVDAHDAELKDVRWKLEEMENRMRRNNLRVLGVPEKIEGENVRMFVIQLFKDTLPELSTWNWELEVQRAHRTPFTLRATKEQSKYPRAILVYFGNFLLRQAIAEKARPDAHRTRGEISYFVRPDFCHTTVERRWRLRQLIKPFLEKKAQVYLNNPATLKVIYKGHAKFFTSEIKAKDFLDSMN